MKAISIIQPWPWALFNLGKDIENRRWPSNYRGPLLIHASKKWTQEGYNFISDRMDEYVPSKEHHAFGAIVGIVEMVDCVDRSESKWFFGPWGFEFDNAQEFKKPIPWRGQVKLFDVPDSIIPAQYRGEVVCHE